MEEQTLQEPTETPVDPPEVPFLFGCALWVPVAAVLLYFFLWFLRPRPIGTPIVDDPEPTDEVEPTDPLPGPDDRAS